MVGELLTYVQEPYNYLWKNMALKVKGIILANMIDELSDHLIKQVVFF